MDDRRRLELGQLHFGGFIDSDLFLLLVWIFVPLGQIVGRQMNLASNPLAGYSWNLLGSLLGILVFFSVSRMMLQPWVWLGIVLAGFAMLQSNAKDRALLLSLLLPLALLLHDPANRDHYSIWTPYQQIEYSRIYARNGDFAHGELKVKAHRRERGERPQRTQRVLG